MAKLKNRHKHKGFRFSVVRFFTKIGLFCGSLVRFRGKGEGEERLLLRWMGGDGTRFRDNCVDCVLFVLLLSVWVFEKE